MNFEELNPQFYAFELEEIMIGLSFCNEKDATSLASKVRSRIPKVIIIFFYLFPAHSDLSGCMPLTKMPSLLTSFTSKKDSVLY